MPSRALILIFRHKLLLASPFLIAVPLAIAFVLLTGEKTYQSFGNVWVARPALLESVVDQAWNPYISPAANQAELVSQRLKTGVFTERVAENASTNCGWTITSGEVRSGTWAGAAGTNLLAIGHNGPDGTSAHCIATAVIASYGEVEREQTLAASKQAEEFFQAELDEVESRREAATEAVNDYIVTHPALSSYEVQQRDVAFQTLESDRKRAEESYFASLGKLNAIKQLIKQTDAGQSQTFQPTDAAEIPLAPLPRAKMDLIGPPALAFLLAVAVSAAMFGFLYRTDNTLRSIDDLVMLPGIQLIGVVPDISHAGGRGTPQHFVRLIAATGREIPNGPHGG